MGKIRFQLKHRVTTLFHSTSRYQRIEPSSTSWGVKSISKLFSWTHNLKNKAKFICSNNSHLGSKRGYVSPVQDKPVAVPKGYITVYLGQKDGGFERVLVPVIYFNHPLFGKLLREAEDEYGFDHSGGITLPCRISEFEHVQTRINQGQTTRIC